MSLQGNFLTDSFIYICYFQNFRKALEEKWKVQLSHRSKSNISFSEPNACVRYDSSNLRGWTVTSDTTDCTVRDTYSI